MKEPIVLDEVCKLCGLSGYYEHCESAGCKGRLVKVQHADFSKDIRAYTRGKGEFRFSKGGGMHWNK